MRIGTQISTQRGGDLRAWSLLAAVGLGVWIVVDLTGRAFFGAVPWPQSVVDYRIIYEASRHVYQTHAFPVHSPYPYPPPAIALHAASAIFPFSVAAALWLILTGCAAVAVYAIVAAMLDLHRRPGGLWVLPLAHLGVAYYFQWDFRSINCNVLVLAAIVLGVVALRAERGGIAGFWLALAVALKLIPVLLLPYLAWTHRWRALRAALVFSAFFWVVLPLIAFGPEGFVPVYAGWYDELTRATNAATKDTHPILISLTKAAQAAFPENAAATVVGSMIAAWVVLGLVGAWTSWRLRTANSETLLTHTSLVVIGPAAVNPYLEPYHLVALVLPSLLLVAAATDSRRPVHVRAVAAVGFVAALVIVKLSSPWPLRGLVVNLQALVLCATALIVARRPSSATADRRAEPRWPFVHRLPRWLPQSVGVPSQHG
ncbi:MAG: glycosyltransferase family 87 protein [Gemmataceae bacterium]|nr:DUF2029 domain-containing protein [Gemmata sp.]MDW8198423.1 glycosyltransferase family 87 protein [Gemmataceae bacterium]